MFVFVEWFGGKLDGGIWWYLMVDGGRGNGGGRIWRG